MDQVGRLLTRKKLFGACPLAGTIFVAPAYQIFSWLLFPVFYRQCLGLYCCNEILHPGLFVYVFWRTRSPVLPMMQSSFSQTFFSASAFLIECRLNAKDIGE